MGLDVCHRPVRITVDQPVDRHRSGQVADGAECRLTGPDARDRPCRIEFVGG